MSNLYKLFFMTFLMLSCSNAKNVDSIKGVWKVKELQKNIEHTEYTRLVCFSDTLMYTWHTQIGGVPTPIPYGLSSDYKQLYLIADKLNQRANCGNLSIISKDSFTIENEQYLFMYSRLNHISEKQIIDISRKDFTEEIEMFKLWKSTF